MEFLLTARSWTKSLPAPSHLTPSTAQQFSPRQPHSLVTGAHLSHISYFQRLAIKHNNLAKMLEGQSRCNVGGHWRAKDLSNTIHKTSST